MIPVVAVQFAVEDKSMTNKEVALARFTTKVEEGRKKFKAIRNRQYWRQAGKRTVVVLKSPGYVVEQSY